MDWHENSMAETESLVRALDQGAEDCVLDLCCGYGRYAIPLAAHGMGVAGLDLSTAMLQRASQTRAPLASTSIGCREMHATCRSARALADFSIPLESPTCPERREQVAWTKGRQRSASVHLREPVARPLALPSSH